MKNRYYFDYTDGVMTVSVNAPDASWETITEISLTDFADITKIMANPEATDELVMNAIGEAQI